MSEQLHIRKKADGSDSTTESSQIQVHVHSAQARLAQSTTPRGLQPQRSSSPNVEDQLMRSYQHEETILAIQAKHGTISPAGQERLTVVQAKMTDYWQPKLESANVVPQIPIQRKLTIGQPNDKYEQEADRVAAQVVNQIHAPTALAPAVQREEMPEEELQMKPIPQLQTSGDAIAAPPDLETAINQARGGGQSLDQTIREPIEQAMGADFSGVKVHTDAQADQLNRSVQARAFTTGQDVFFRQGEYNPGSRGGQELIAHELTHVVQQNGGGVQRSRPTKPNKGDVSDPAVPQNQGLIKRSMEKLKIQKDGEGETGSATQKWREKYSKYKSLWAGIAEGMELKAAADQLLENFKKRTDFKYTGFKAPFNGEGTCETLSDEFAQILIYGFGYKNGVTRGTANKPMLIGECEIIDSDRKTGNVENGGGWIFVSHTWAVVGGEVYDVLFKQKGRKEHTLGEKKDKYFIFSGEEYVRNEVNNQYRRMEVKTRRM